MSCAVMLQPQISAIMDVLVKAAVAEISQLLEDDAAAAALHEQIHRRNDEIRRRNEEIQELKARLILTETQLQRSTADTCSVAVQVDVMDTSVPVHSQDPRADYFVEEKTIMTSPEEKPHITHPPHIHNSHSLRREEMIMSSEELRAQPEDEEISGLEFEMKIEQVEELVDQKLNEVQTEQNSEGQNHRKPASDDRNSHVWLSGESLTDQQSQTFTDSYVSQVLMENPMSSQSGLFASGVMSENESFTADKDIEYSLNHLTATRQDSHRRAQTPPRNCTTDSDVFSRFPSSHVYVEDHPRRNIRPKPFRCEECGKGFTQKTRLITHRRVHTGEKPFHCQLCGKTFSRQDNCLRHVRLHSGQQRW